ncbi:GAF domain-containing protein [Deinococcus maricopensis]|uniref:GAF domain protein n=1 Tax=Deinococcus maricopensis (strain DSM 21211 / LMG 22137 / NRRL B-23946 / LB-34) TaxID=709986 RepID=E8U4R9_DEIML|nr:GAF domain-containing protein [Deinococcus maricopensis]ADV66058.1 GAF domain protein [Deinococcus maricopensis DSM 21211]
MIAAPFPQDEYARLLDLARYDVLDSAPEGSFDRITTLAAQLFNVPVALINFIDQDRQWSKSCYGVDASAAPRALSPCAWTILSDEPTVVLDAGADPRFSDNPLMNGDPRIHLYAGAPLTTPAGHRIGTLCVLDVRPREFGAQEVQALQDLAAIVQDELELRVRNAELQRQVGAQAQVVRELRRTVSHAQTLEAVATLLDTPLTAEEATRAAAGLVGQAIQADWTGLAVFEGQVVRAVTAYHRPDLNPALLARIERLEETPGGVTRHLQSVQRAYYVDDYALHPQAMPEMIQEGLMAAAWVPVGEAGSARLLLVTMRTAGSRLSGWSASDRALLETAARTMRLALTQRATGEPRSSS